MSEDMTCRSCRKAVEKGIRLGLCSFEAKTSASGTSCSGYLCIDCTDRLFRLTGHLYDLMTGRLDPSRAAKVDDILLEFRAADRALEDKET